MISCQAFYEALLARQIDCFAGVPDSLLKNICAYITDNTPSERHIITPNEGNAIAFATGYHLATGHVPLVYMQNSGLGNTINPLTSLADSEVYAIPMLLLIGWRGQPGLPDEPQHVKMGRITPALLESLEIPHWTLPTEWSQAEVVLYQAIDTAKRTSAPVALLVQEGTFSPYRLQKPGAFVQNNLTREAAIATMAKRLPDNAIVVSTTGKISRELYEYRENTHPIRHEGDFLVVGAMGHTSQIALGLAVGKPERPVVCLDGDGSLLMHMGSLGTAGVLKRSNFYHIILNNWAHESVGGQPTLAGELDIPAIAAACGYRHTLCVKTEDELIAILPTWMGQEGPALLEVRVELGSRADLGRPKEKPVENKYALMEGLRNVAGSVRS